MQAFIVLKSIPGEVGPPIGVFSTRELADAAIVALGMDPKETEWWDVKEFEVDAPIPDQSD